MGQRRVALILLRNMKNPFAGLLRKTPGILGLDIGSSAVKAVQLKPAGRTYRLTALGVAPLAPDVIVDGTIKNPSAVVDAIRRAVPKGETKGKDAAVAILDIGGMNDRVQQQTQRIYEKMAFLALDLFARIVAMRVDAGPPFSALFTLWLSMMAAVGLASRCSRSRHCS